MGLSAAGNHHRRRSSVLTGALTGASERRDESLRAGDTGPTKWDEQEPLTAEDTDASDLSSSAVETRELDVMSSDDDQHDEETGLTAHQKRQRWRRRRQRRKLDARIAGVKSPRSILQLGLADRNVIKKLLVNVGLILLWYFFSLSISIVSRPHQKHVAGRSANHSLPCSTTNGCSPRTRSSSPP